MRTADERIILITGATDGLGRQVAEDLAARGVSLLLHGRNLERGEAVLDQIRSTTGNQRLRYYNGNLASLAAVRRLAEEISGDQPRLDVLVNNAGLGRGARPTLRETSADGYELRFAVNYLAPFLLTRLLIPMLRRAAEERGEARIVNVASSSQMAFDLEDPMMNRGYYGMCAYSQSKLALVMFTFDLARELAGTGITVNALHPATLMDTKLVREGFGTPRTEVGEGARALERLVVADELTGEYFEGRWRARAKAQAYDKEARRRLREMSEWWAGLRS